MAEGVRPEDYCDEPVDDEFGEIIKCRSGRRGNSVCVCVYTRSFVLPRACVVFPTITGRLNSDITTVYKALHLRYSSFVGIPFQTPVPEAHLIITLFTLL